MDLTQHTLVARPCLNRLRDHGAGDEAGVEGRFCGARELHWRTLEGLIVPVVAQPREDREYRERLGTHTRVDEEACATVLRNAGPDVLADSEAVDCGNDDICVRESFGMLGRAIARVDALDLAPVGLLRDLPLEDVHFGLTDVSRPVHLRTDVLCAHLVEVPHGKLGDSAFRETNRCRRTDAARADHDDAETAERIRGDDIGESGEGVEWFVLLFGHVSSVNFGCATQEMGSFVVVINDEV